MMKLEKTICNAFSRAATAYETVAVAQREIGERMLERLEYIKLAPKFILDLGCGPGRLTQSLAARYAEAHLVGLDFSSTMLSEALWQPLVTSNLCFLQSDMHHLPFAEKTFQLVFANQVIHWSTDMMGLFQSVYRVLEPGGCFLFSTLGPDTFFEIKDAWARVDYFDHVMNFPDMHQIGDSLLKASFLDPVVDREDLTIHYPAFSDLIRGLKAQGVYNIHPNKNFGLTGKHTWQKFQNTYERRWLTETGKAPLRYEIIYGLAWKGYPKPQTVQNEVQIPLSALKRRSPPDEPSA